MQPHFFTTTSKVLQHLSGKHGWRKGDGGTPSIVTFTSDLITDVSESGEKEVYNIHTAKIARGIVRAGVFFEEYNNFLDEEVVNALKKLPTRPDESTIRKRYFPFLMKRAREVIKGYVANRHISLIFDESTNGGHKLFAVVAVTHDSSFLLHVEVVDAQDPGTAAVLFDRVKRSLTIMNVPLTRVVSVCTDNGPDARGARNLLSREYPHIFVVPCMSHGLALVVKSILGPAKNRGEERVFSSLYDLMVSVHSFFFGRGSTCHRKAKLQGRLGKSFITALDFVDTRWGTILTAMDALRSRYVDVLAFLQEEIDAGGEALAARRLLAQMKSSFISGSIEVCLHLFENMVLCLKSSQVSGEFSSDTDSVRKLVSDVGALRNDLLRCREGRTSNFSARVARASSGDEVEESALCVQFENLLISGGRIAAAKFDQRVAPALEALRYKILLDPILLYSVGSTGVIREWYEWERSKYPVSQSRRRPMPENSTYPDLLLDPLLDKLVSLGKITKSGCNSVCVEWERYFHAAMSFTESRKNKKPSKMAKFGDNALNIGVNRFEREEDDEGEYEPPTKEEFWREVSCDGFRHVLLLAEYVTLIVVTNADVERKFNIMRHILHFTRSGNISNELLCTEFFLRSNDQFFVEKKLEYCS